MSREARVARAHLGPVLVGAMLGSLVAGRTETAGLCLVVGVLAAHAAGASYPSARWTLMLGAGAAFAWALNLYLTPGEPLAGAWPVLAGRHATDEGLRLGGLLTLRCAGACAALQGLRAAWPGERAADGAARWLAPLERCGVPVREARAMLGLALRFAPLVGAEAARIARVQALRAGRKPRGVGERLQRLRAGAVPALVGSLERAERVALALEARHYRVSPVAGSSGAPWRGGHGGEARAAGGWTVAGMGVAALALLWRR